MTPENLDILLQHFIDRTLSPRQAEELAGIFSGIPNSTVTDELMISALTALHEKSLLTNELLVDASSLQPAIDRITSIDKNIAPEKIIPITHRVHLLKTSWFRAAVAILIMLSFGTYFWFSPSRDIADLTPPPSNPASIDVLPGSDKAILTLSNGNRVELSNTNGRIIKDGPLTITNGGGELSYKNAEMVVINTMSTPKGGQYKLILADGTKVWLNAASSITFPTAFNGSEREVSITGEAYLEVAKNKEKPFIITTNKEKVLVLGTSININNYADEFANKITLIAGSIRVEDKILIPGQAYQIGKIMKTNIQQDIAWKNRIFDFNDLTIAQAMRQLSRWYDIEVVYREGVPTERLFGKMDRNLSLQQVLEGLTGIAARFKLEGKILYVSPL